MQILKNIKLSSELTVKELKKICIEADIKYYGTKAACIGRIKKKD